MTPKRRVHPDTAEVFNPEGQEAADQVLSDLLRVFGDRWAGSWQSEDDGGRVRLHLRIVDLNDEDRNLVRSQAPKDLRVELHSARYSREQLLSFQARVEQLVNTHRSELHGGVIGIDSRANKVKLTVTASIEALFAQVRNEVPLDAVDIDLQPGWRSFAL